ncbi:hypothetical protein CPB83DRAFT_848926 [Crepidotus variabilis]|uniref:Uncharacterized protein n=1 Tax=Crepidotus variabilis TaxID=179855 RepID=A0A9P6JRZ0_9AGAR|nr:hypothetical protein CPB83DRAFT_848926 [Crepidotus variabilis]
MGLLSPSAAPSRDIYRTPSSTTMPLVQSPPEALIHIGRSPEARSMTMLPSISAMQYTTFSPPNYGYYTPKSPSKRLPDYEGSPQMAGGYPFPSVHINHNSGTPKGFATPMSLRSELYTVPTTGSPRRKERPSFGSRRHIDYDSDVFEDSDEDLFPEYPLYDQRGRSNTSLPLNSSSLHHPSILSSRPGLGTPRKSVSFGLPPDYIPISRPSSRSRSRGRNTNSRAFDDYTDYASAYHNHDHGRSTSRSQSRSRDDRRRSRAVSQSYMPSYVPMQSALLYGPPPPPHGHGVHTPSSGSSGGGYQIYKLPPSLPPSALPMTPMMAYTSPNPGQIYRSSSSARPHSGHRRRYSDTQSLGMVVPSLVQQSHSIGPVYPQQHQHHRHRSLSHSSQSKDKARVYQVPSSPGYYPVTIANSAPAASTGGFAYHYHRRSKGTKHSRSDSTAELFETKPKSSRRSSTSAINAEALKNMLVKESDRERKERKDRERQEKENNSRYKEQERRRKKEKEWMKKWEEEDERLQRRGSRMSMPMVYGGYAVGVPMAAPTNVSLPPYVLESKPKKQVRFRRGSY